MGFTDLNNGSANRVDGADKVYIDGPAGVFGDLQTVVIQPQAQGDFVYGIQDTTFLTYSYTGGSVTVFSGVASISTVTEANGSAHVRQKRALR